MGPTWSEKTKNKKPPKKIASAVREQPVVRLKLLSGVAGEGLSKGFHFRKICLTFLQARCHDALQI
jgi:hypothetical protein